MTQVYSGLSWDIDEKTEEGTVRVVVLSITDWKSCQNNLFPRSLNKFRSIHYSCLQAKTMIVYEILSSVSYSTTANSYGEGTEQADSRTLIIVKNGTHSELGIPRELLEGAGVRGEHRTDRSSRAAKREFG